MPNPEDLIKAAARDAAGKLLDDKYKRLVELQAEIEAAVEEAAKAYAYKEFVHTNSNLYEDSGAKESSVDSAYTDKYDALTKLMTAQRYASSEVDALGPFAQKFRSKV